MTQANFSPSSSELDAGLGNGQPVRVRFAPSPTGYLHVGGARTALYNYLLAKRWGGKFILRIEDTDEDRSTEESLKIICRDLKWLGLSWEEGPQFDNSENPEPKGEEGRFGPYRQSQRRALYLQYADQLLQSGKAYYCFMTEEEMEAQRAKLMASQQVGHVESPYQDWSLERALEHKEQTRQAATVRFRTRGLRKDYVFQDLVRGEVRFPSDMVGDFVLLRSDGMPVYNFCCVVDDHLMEISHVLRAEEHLSNTLRQLMIYEALGWQPPRIGHLSLVLNEQRQKLSKRHDSVAVEEFREEGYLPDALLNFVALLGWSSPEEKELMSLADMQRSFSLDRLHSSGAVFDRVKLKWMNSQHLRSLPTSELARWVQPFLEANQVAVPSPEARFHQCLDAAKSVMEVLTDAVGFFRQLQNHNFLVLPESKEVLGWPQSAVVLRAWEFELNKLVGEEGSWDEAGFLAAQAAVQAATGAKGKHLFMPIRVAVLGKPSGMELKMFVPLLPKSALLYRVKQVLAHEFLLDEVSTPGGST